MCTRFEALARGSQPAVVKLASYGGGGRAAAMISYAAREGQLSIETERGERVSGKEALTALCGEWEHLFDNRADSRDVAVFNVTVGHTSFDGRDIDAVAREVLQVGFRDRRFVFAVDERAGDELTVRGVVVLRERTGERLTGDRKAAEIVQQRFDDNEFGSGVDAHFRFHGHGNGVRFATARVRDLVERFDGEVRDETGCLISTAEDAGDLVQKDWRHEMHSRKGRDIMHLIVSARAGTELNAFHEAVRDFLGSSSRATAMSSPCTTRPTIPRKLQRAASVRTSTLMPSSRCAPRPANASSQVRRCFGSGGRSWQRRPVSMASTWN
jgi:hypothetical protein